MKNLIKIFFSLVILNLILNANADAQTVMWSKWYDYEHKQNEGYEAIQTFDGGYLVLTNNYTFSDFSSLLIKTDNFGNFEWTKIIDKNLTGGNGLNCYSVQQAIDSGFVVSGYGIDSAILLKTNVNGDLLWLKKYSIMGLESRFFNHKITSDNEIIAIGDLYPPFRGYVVKTDQNGIIQWERFYNIALIKSTIIESKFDGCYYFTRENLISKIDSIGGLIWTKNYQNIGEDLLQAQNGDIYCGAGQSDFYLTKLDTSGKFIWQKSYNPNANFTSFCLSKDGNILMVGGLQKIGSFDVEIFTIKTDLNGNQIYRKYFTFYKGNFYAFPTTVNSTNDSGFIITGGTSFPNSAFYHDNTFITKTDSNCNAPVFVNINEQISSNPMNFILYQNYPNPFNSSTRIRYELVKPGFIKLDIYDIQGKFLKNIIDKYQQSGEYEFIFNAENLQLSSGTYFLRLAVSQFESQNKQSSVIKKLLYLK